MFALLLAAVMSCVAQDGATPDALWVEGEAYYAQRGSVGPDRPPFGSRGECLGSSWSGRQGDFVVYRIWLDAPWAEATLYLRYARLPQSDSRFDLFCDGKAVARGVALATTAGWGHLRDDEWRYEVVPLGALEKGWRELKLVSLADKNNTNVDGFFLAGPAFQPPTTRGEIEAFPRPRLRRAADAAGPDWVDEGLSLADFRPTVDDWYYPPEEPDERAALAMPVLVAVDAETATLAAAADAKPEAVPVNGELEGWRLAATLAEPEPIAVLEREFDRWGMFVYLGKQGVVAEIRKAVGRLDAIERPYARFPADYFEQLLPAKEDVLASKVLASGDDPSYEDVAAYLAPLQTYTFLGSPESAKKYVVQPDGAIGVLPNRWGRIKPLETTLFDPADVLPDDFIAHPRHVKLGSLGGYLPAVNQGYWDAEKRIGWELCALADVGESPTTLVRVRRTDAGPEFYQLDPLERLGDGKAFFAALLRLKRSWDEFFEGGMRLEVADRRVQDAARAAIARALSGCVGLHPKYGMGGYWGADDRHDSFPPTTLSLCTCLLDWGFAQAAGERLGYYFDRFVNPDGTLTYYGPAVAEYAELLDQAAQYVRRTGDAAWLDAHRPALDAIAGYLLRLRQESLQSQPPDAPGHGLLFGGAEADTRKDTNYYFSGSAWCWRGLRELGSLYVDQGERRPDAALGEQGRKLLGEGEALRNDLLRAVERSVIHSGDQAFLPPIAGHKEPFDTMTQDRLASYTNYRYWLETLSARCLTPEHERMMLDYRRANGGELLAMTRFSGHLDDWPFWHQACSMLWHDRVSHYLLGYYAHLAHHQTPGTFTAYEQVPIRGYGLRREQADYCVPSQLTIPIMTRWMLVFEERDADVLWLCRAVPRRWLASELTVDGALTRFGRVGLRIDPSDDLRQMTARITLDGDGAPKPTVMLRVRHPKRLRIATCDVTGGKCEAIDAEREVVPVRPERKTAIVDLTFCP